MTWGFVNNKFYIDVKSCSRPIGSYRQEIESRARELSNNKLMLCLSSGMDSQIVLHTFKSLDIPFECAFLRTDGFNETEFQNLKRLEQKYGIKAEIVNINPDSHKEEIEHLAIELDVHPNHALQYLFAKKLPLDCDIVQSLATPWVVNWKDNLYMYSGYYDPEKSRYRAISKIPNRTGEFINFDDTSEIALSYINDDLFKYFIQSWDYYENNLIMPNRIDFTYKSMPQVYRYDFYVKPLFIAKNWGDELIYFPKIAGYENISWINSIEDKSAYDRHHIIMPIQELIDHYQSQTTAVKRYMSYR
jgi:hypothetical protein